MNLHKAYSEDFEIKGQLKQFWEIEEVYPNHISSLDDCEQIFQNTFCRNVEGRFVVSLPLKQDVTILGDSYEQARKRFSSLERKLSMNPQLKEMYTNFMEEYETVGHMTKLESVDNTTPCYYLPHHGVFKESSLTTKLRVDASAPSSSGFSLNDIQLVDPTIQDDLFSILIRFRQHTYVVSAAIAKMYRQVLIDPKYRCLQRILWRSDPSKPLHIYQLNTVTYGTASAPYLAVKCLKQLAIEHMDNFPRAANAIVHDFYVDDFLSGSDTIEEAQLLCNQVSQILQGGCFELRKWISNNPQILTVLNSSKVSSPQVILFKQSEVKDKGLGIQWNWSTDNLTYSIPNYNRTRPFTKRNLLSDISKIFDPLGLLSPVVVNAKLLIQKIWQLNLSWDDIVPESIKDSWLTFTNELKSLRKNSILRNKHLQTLTPFIDHDGLLRVGGRLANSELNFNQRCSLLLDGNQILAKLLFRHEHIRLLHAGPQLLLSSIRNEFWPTKGRNLARKIVRDCIKCFRFKAESVVPIMGQLPKHRVTANHPFYATGVDYAGPVLIRDKRGRGSKIIKAYISLFVCLSTKAIHLEPVTDLTTESFLSVLHRFCARRGKPTVMYSDNGTNFVGTNSELSQLKTFFENSEYSIVQSLATEGIDWKFIPPSAPLFGGLWEAGVKSTKFHIRRVLANVSITFEELLTVLTQVEGILNSRPIFPMSSDPNDLNALTPGHFLIGRPITFLPQPNLLEVKENTLSRYQRLQ
ncbi:hypothetical protein Trydic_g16131 [Trypoxylus dichotomus]